jgi:hypothetical protein
MSSPGVRWYNMASEKVVLSLSINYITPSYSNCKTNDKEPKATKNMLVTNQSGN